MAIQNFFENLAMLAGTGLYALLLGRGLDPVVAVLGLGLFVVAATLVVAWHLPKAPHADTRPETMRPVA